MPVRRLPAVAVAARSAITPAIGCAVARRDAGAPPTAPFDPAAAARRGLGLLACLAAGLATAVILAWLLALTTSLDSAAASRSVECWTFDDADSTQMPFRREREVWATERPDGFPAAPTHADRSRPGFGVEHLLLWDLKPAPEATPDEANAESPDDLGGSWTSPTYLELHVVSAGFPARCLRTEVWWEGAFIDDEAEAMWINDGFVAWRSVEDPRFIPFEPMPAGLAINAVFWGGLAYLGATGLVRAARGATDACARSRTLSGRSAGDVLAVGTPGCDVACMSASPR